MTLQILNTLFVIAVNFSLFKHIGQKENKKYLIYSLIGFVIFFAINLLFNEKEFNDRIFLFPLLSSSILIFYYFFLHSPISKDVDEFSSYDKIRYKKIQSFIIRYILPVMATLSEVNIIWSSVQEVQ
ncbi:MAG: hypothetical protein RSE50_02385 [Myroides sp.]